MSEEVEPKLKKVVVSRREGKAALIGIDHLCETILNPWTQNGSVQNEFNYGIMSQCHFNCQIIVISS